MKRIIAGTLIAAAFAFAEHRPTQCQIWLMLTKGEKLAMLWGMEFAYFDSHNEVIVDTIAYSTYNIEGIDKVCKDPDNKYVQIVDAAALAHYRSIGSVIRKNDLEEIRRRGYKLYRRWYNSNPKK
ncbi:hypothetical protein [Hydrogenimonas urashimensis]|uniref:hypothetical protein n=1 Tax=Hydrogenimonas urashimensis TaxID=2740515 RepID=UPI001915720E|nr:hypothetical protein [Hydrogenimonas urashimensis]